jgi:WD40 repeat protein
MSDAVTCVTFVGGGDRLLIGAADGSLRMIGTNGGSEVLHVQHDGRVNAVAHRDMRGKNLVASCDSAGNVELNFLSDGVHVSLPHAQGVEALGFDEEGAVMATGSEDGLCRVFSLSPDGEVHLLCQLAHDAKGSGPSVNELSPDQVPYGPVRMVFGDENSRSMFDRVVESRRRSERTVKDVSVTSRGDLVATASGDGACRVLDVARCVEIAKFPYKYAMDAVAISPMGDRVAYATLGGNVHVHSLHAVTGQEKHWEAKNAMAKELLFSPDGKTLACAGTGELHVYDATDGRPIQVVTDERYNLATCVAFSADGRYAASGGTSRKARVYETEGWTVVAGLQQESAVWAVCLNADGSLLATGTDLRTAHVFDVHAKKEIVRVRHDAQLTAVAMDRDGKILVTGSEDQTARVWWIAPDQLMEQAASRITRPMSDEEQRRFFGTLSDRDR